MPRALSPLPNKKFFRNESSSKTDLGEESLVQLSHNVQRRNEEEEIVSAMTRTASQFPTHQLGEPKHLNFSQNLHSRQLTGGEVKKDSSRNGSDRLFGDLNGAEENEGVTRLVVRLWEDNLGKKIDLKKTSGAPCVFY